MAEIAFRGVWKVYGKSVEAVKDMNLQIKDGEFVSLLGPSGCGKSSTLRMVAGLEEITRGELEIGGRRINDVEPGDRDVAMVFENYALFPHMSSYDNIAFPLTLRGVDKQEIRKKVQEISKLLDLDGLLKTLAVSLGGGEKQRVGIARALMQEPRVILADEPVASLDPATSHSVLKYIEELKDDGITVLCALHFLSLARRYGTRLIALKGGRIVFTGYPQDIDEARFKEIYGEEAVEVEIA